MDLHRLHSPIPCSHAHPGDNGSHGSIPHAAVHPSWHYLDIRWDNIRLPAYLWNYQLKIMAQSDSGSHIQSFLSFHSTHYGMPYYQVKMLNAPAYGAGNSNYACRSEKYMTHWSAFGVASCKSLSEENILA